VETNLASPATGSQERRHSRLPQWATVREVAVFLLFTIYFLLYGLTPIFGGDGLGLVGADEPRYAQVAREMLARHDWITPTLNGTPWLEKPPLYYWQAMIAFAIFGVRDWVARVPSAIDASLVVLAVYFFLKKLRPGFHLDGALMTASAAGLVGFAHSASTDMPLAAMFSLAMLCCVVIAAPLGMLVGYVLPREMEGTLLLLTAVALQMIIDPASRIAKLTPFWSSREIGTYAVDHTGTGYLVRGAVHGAVVILLMLAFVAIASSARLRRRSHLRRA